MNTIREFKRCDAEPATVYHSLDECPAYQEHSARLDSKEAEAATQLRKLR